ncbi:GNAT family N-acetyltransferase [Streptomyces sp. ODS28]|uniref:GNAT family N-acetyltransferase n=1 Tax=Streptomyces sp. ODS28 TaxID=3136688 RepID=UPI0031E7E364
MTRSTAPAIQSAGLDDVPEIAELIATAFAPLAVARWLVPHGPGGPDDTTERVRRLTANFAVHVEHALEHGHIDLTGDRTGVAVWVHQEPGAPEPPEPAGYPARLAASAGPHLARFQALDEAFGENHPQEPHHHLAFLAVHPGRQGDGLGTALLHHHHAALEAAGRAGYLEASSERSRALYRRHGYRDMGDPFHLRPDGPPMWPMWREAGAR